MAPSAPNGSKRSNGSKSINGSQDLLRPDDWTGQNPQLALHRGMTARCKGRSGRERSETLLTADQEVGYLTHKKRHTPRTLP